MMHIGIGITLSKTESIYLPPARWNFFYCRLAPLEHTQLRRLGGSAVGFANFTKKKFEYLGSIIDSSLISDADVDRRTKAATSAFGALMNVPTNLSVGLRVKGRTYTLQLTFWS